LFENYLSKQVLMWLFVLVGDSMSGAVQCRRN